MGGLLHLVQRGGAWAGCGPAQSTPRCTKCNLSTTSVPITVLLYDGPLLCDFNVAIKGLKFVIGSRRGCPTLRPGCLRTVLIGSTIQRSKADDVVYRRDMTRIKEPISFHEAASQARL